MSTLSTGARRLRAPVAALAVLLAFGGLASAGAPPDVDAPPAEEAWFAVNDVQGADDEPGQKDLNRQGSYIDAEAGAAGAFWFYIQWDQTFLTGKNTMDGCALFDVDAEDEVGYGFADKVVCMTFQRIRGNNPANNVEFKGTGVSLYQCLGDDRDDRCSQPMLDTDASPAISCRDDAPTGNPPAGSIQDPFGPGGDAEAAGHLDELDVRGLCAMEVGDGTFLGDVDVDDVGHLNSCSYPSQEPNSDPSDCVVVTIETLPVEVALEPDHSFVAEVTVWADATVQLEDATPVAYGTLDVELWTSADCSTGTRLYDDSWDLSLIAEDTDPNTSPGAIRTDDTVIQVVGLADGTVFLDLNGDGDQDSPDEPTIASFPATFYWSVEYTGGTVIDGLTVYRYDGPDADCGTATSEVTVTVTETPYPAAP